MKPVTICKNIWKIGSNLNTAELFEGIWPIPYGVSVNSYLLKGDKTVLIDLIKNDEESPKQYEAQLKDLGVSFADIDILVLNHLEPDHTGFLAELVAQNTDLKILCSKKGAALVKSFYKIENQVEVVANGQSLDIGGRTLVFYETPNIHWPETIMTYCPEEQILFSCDAFGSFGAVEEGADFDDQVPVEKMEFYEKEALRYYANIVSTFSSFVLKGIEKLKDLKIKVIAPSHGLVWRAHPEKIIGDYIDYARYLNGPAQKRVTVIWSSMYGNTEKMLETVLENLEKCDIDYSVYKIPRDSISFVLADVWRSKGLIIGMPTYEYKMFPPMAHAIDIFDRSHVKNKKVFRFGSFGWSGGAQKQFDEMTAGLNWSYLPAVEWAGAPDQKDKEACAQQVCELARWVLADQEDL